MNEYDGIACSAIQKYYLKNGSYPQYIEATSEFLAKMSQIVFRFLEPIEQESNVHRVGDPQYKEIDVLVVLVKE